MSIDASIPLSVKQVEIPDQLDKANKALTMSNLMQQGQMNQLKLTQEQRQVGDDTSMRNAFKNNMITLPDGTQALNQQGVMSELNNKNPLLAMKASAQFQQAALDKQEREATLKSDLIKKVTGPEDWDAFVKEAHANGLANADKLPTQYPGQDAVFRMKLGTESNAAQIAYQKTQMDLKRQQQEADAKSLEARAAAANAGIPSGPAGAGAGASNLVASNGKGIPGKPAGLSDVDPAVLLSRVPMKDRDKVAEEIKDQANIVNVGKTSLQDFDRAAKEVRPLTGGTGTSGTAFVPGMESAAQKAFLGGAFTTVKGIEGSVRQAQFDAIKSKFMPEFGDSDSTIESKRASWIDYLKSHSAAPLAKNYGIDLKKYKSTSLPDDIGSKGDQKTLPEGATKEYNGKTYKVVGDHWVSVSDQAKK